MPGNDFVDSDTKAATQTTKTLAGPSLRGPSITGKLTGHHKIMSGQWKRKVDSPGQQNAQQLEIVHLFPLAHHQAGHTPLLKAHARFSSRSVDLLCRLCKDEPQMIVHWLWRCPRLDVTRQGIF